MVCDPQPRHPLPAAGRAVAASVALPRGGLCPGWAPSRLHEWKQAAIAASRCVGRISRPACLAWAVATLLVWSASYLLRHPGPAALEPPSPFGSFAIEGVVLALAWLGAWLGAGALILSGAVVLRDPPSHD
jgi:hypothetical protein